MLFGEHPGSIRPARSERTAVDDVKQTTQSQNLEVFDYEQAFFRSACDERHGILRQADQDVRQILIQQKTNKKAAACG